MKFLIAVFLIVNSIIYANEVKSNINLTSLIDQIETISNKIIQKEVELQEIRAEQMRVEPTKMMLPPAEIKRQKQEEELSNKKRNIEYLRKKYAVDDELKEVNKKNKFVLLKRLKKLISKVNIDLLEFDVGQKIVLPVKDYFVLGKKLFVYIEENDMKKSMDEISSIQKKHKQLANINRLIKYQEGFNASEVNEILERAKKLIFKDDLSSNSKTRVKNNLSKDDEKLIKITNNEYINGFKVIMASIDSVTLQYQD